MFNPRSRMLPMIAKLVTLLIAVCALPAPAASPESVPVKLVTSGSIYTAEGTIEPVKITQIAAEMQGNIIVLAVKAGDVVKAGQVLARIDTRVASQQVASSKAQAAAADAQLSAARLAYDRKKLLLERRYISQAAIEQAEAEYKTAEAEARAQQAQTSIANVKTDLHTVLAPYNGIVAQVMAEIGDMAMPGKLLLVLYDPKMMRVLASVPQDRLSQIDPSTVIQVEIPGSAQPSIKIPIGNMTVLPVADAVSHQMQVRVALPDGLKGITPGMFSRLKLTIKGSHEIARLYVPTSSVMRRGELALVYVVIGAKTQLRQVRPGQTQGGLIEVLSGLDAGEQVALNPLTAIAASKDK